MSLINEKGKIISYESSTLIKQLEQDIAKFGGDTIVAAWCKEYDGVIIYTDYDFFDKNKILQSNEVKNDEYIKKMTMNALIALLKMQNKVI